MARACRAFECLPLLEDAPIMRNILYSGIWLRFESACERRKGEKQAMTDPYQVLGVSPDGQRRRGEKAYRRSASGIIPMRTWASRTPRRPKKEIHGSSAGV